MRMRDSNGAFHCSDGYGFNAVTKRHWKTSKYARFQCHLSVNKFPTLPFELEVQVESCQVIGPSFSLTFIFDFGYRLRTPIRILS